MLLKHTSNARGLKRFQRLPRTQGATREEALRDDTPSICAMIHPTHAGIGLIRLGDSDFVPANLEDDFRGKAVYDA
jgi:hypothetical protein